MINLLNNHHWYLIKSCPNFLSKIFIRIDNSNYNVSKHTPCGFALVPTSITVFGLLLPQRVFQPDAWRYYFSGSDSQCHHICIRLRPVILRISKWHSQLLPQETSNSSSRYHQLNWYHWWWARHRSWAQQLLNKTLQVQRDLKYDSTKSNHIWRHWLN